MPASRRSSTCSRPWARASLDNLVIEIDGPEVPIGDGSFAPFFDCCCAARRRRRRASRRGCWS
jgi:UDP-3-O-acyl-N-acetylglucosamine deacetylase